MAGFFVGLFSLTIWATVDQPSERMKYRMPILAISSGVIN